MRQSSTSPSLKTGNALLDRALACSCVSVRFGQICACLIPCSAVDLSQNLTDSCRISSEFNKLKSQRQPTYLNLRRDFRIELMSRIEKKVEDVRDGSRVVVEIMRFMTRVLGPGEQEAKILYA